MSGELRLHRLAVPAALADRGIDELGVWSVPLTVRFRRIEVREGMVLHGPEGWSEWSPFWDYDPVESASWLRAGIEGATQPVPAARRDRIPVNVTIPVVDADLARTMAAESACTTAKVKVADPRSDLWEDCRRVAAVREAMPDGQIRVDANAAWPVLSAPTRSSMPPGCRPSSPRPWTPASASDWPPTWRLPCPSSTMPAGWGP